MTQLGDTRYTAMAMLLHWLMAVLLVVSFGVGIYMANLPFSPQRVKLFNWHKWAGITILALALLRLGWRAFHTPPPGPALTAWQRRASGLVHALLYVLFFAVPLAGWAYSSATGVPLVWFGVLPLPDLVAANKETAQLLKAWHGALAWTLAVVVCAHVAAAAKHHFIDRDGLLSRMAPRRAARKSS